MLAVYIVAMLVLLSSDTLPSKVYAGSCGSSDSSGSGVSSKSSDTNDTDEQHCKQAEPENKAIENKIKSLSEKNQPLPKCTVRIIIFV